MSTFLLPRTPLMAKRKLDPNPINNKQIFEKLAKSIDRSKSSKKDKNSSCFTNSEFEEVCEIPEEVSISPETLYRFNTKQSNEQFDFGKSKSSIQKTIERSCFYNSKEKESFKTNLLKSVVPDCASKNKLIDKKKSRDYSPPAYIFQENEFSIPTNIELGMENTTNPAKVKDTQSLNSNNQFCPISKDKFKNEYLKKKEGLNRLENSNYRNSINNKAEKNVVKHQMSNINESNNENEIDEEEKWNFNADEMNEDSNT